MIRVTKEEFDTFVRHKDPEVFTESTVNGWVLAHQETIQKADLGDINEIEKSEVEAFNNEFGSLMKVEVVSTSDDLLSKGLKYETFYVREKQIEFDKSEGDDIEKSKHGKYLDTPHNRKMGRVGAEFGEIQKSESESELEKGGEGSRGGKIIGHTKSGKPIYEHQEPKDYSDFSTEEHDEASDIHHKQGMRYDMSDPERKGQHQLDLRNAHYKYARSK